MKLSEKIEELNKHLDEKIDEYQDLVNGITSLPNDLATKYPEVNEYTLLILNILINDLLKNKGAENGKT